MTLTYIAAHCALFFNATGTEVVSVEATEKLKGNFSRLLFTIIVQ